MIPILESRVQITVFILHELTFIQQIMPVDPYCSNRLHKNFIAFTVAEKGRIVASWEKLLPSIMLQLLSTLIIAKCWEFQTNLLYEISKWPL